MEEPRTDNRASDREVFVTDDDRRSKRLRRGAFAATGLACLWLIGLGIGMLGFGGMPGISLGSDKRDKAERPAQEPAPASARFLPSARSLASGQPPQAAPGRSRQVGSRARGRSRVQRAPVRPPAVAPPPAQQAQNPAGRQRGWARKGKPAPPGQVRRAQTKPPPPRPPQGSRGQRRGQTRTTTTTTTTPVPPGQAKKAPPPPPPPEG